MNSPDPKHIVFFDGVCSLCNGYVRFLMKRDREEKFYVAPLDSQTAEDELPDVVQKNNDGRSIIYLNRAGDPEVTRRSEAVLNIVSTLGGMWQWADVLKIVPRFIRDAVYDFIANHRYDWFGKYDACPAPEPGWKQRFLE